MSQLSNLLSIVDWVLLHLLPTQRGEGGHNRGAKEGQEDNLEEEEVSQGGSQEPEADCNLNSQTEAEDQVHHKVERPFVLPVV